MNSANNAINALELPDRCDQCGAQYRNIQHPLKPPGVIMTRECNCKPVFSYVTDAHGNSIGTMTLVPPDP